MKNSVIKLMGIITMVISPFLVHAQILDPVDFEVTVAPEEIKAGEQFDVSIQATIEGKWHLYSINNDPDAGPYPTSFSASNPDHIITGDVTESEAEIEFDPNFEKELGWHTGGATFKIPLVYKTNVTGSSMIDLEVLYQVCDDKSCLPPKKKSITHAITVSGIADQPVEESVVEESGNEGSIEQGQPGASIIPLKPIPERFRKMEKVRLYTDDGAEGMEIQKFQFRLTGTVALPAYEVTDPATEKVLDQLIGYADKIKFQDFLDKGLSRFSGKSTQTTVQLGVN